MGCLFPGRIFLGVGTGEALNEVAVARLDWPDFKERFARLREAVRLMRVLWREDQVSFDGEFYQTSSATIYDRPDGGIPIYIAAGGPVVARYAGRAGDGFICTSGKGMDLYTDKLMPAVDEGLAASGRERSDIDRMIEVKLSYDRDPEMALENTRFWAPLALTAADELPIEQVARRWIVASDPDTALAQIKPYMDAGLNHLVFHGPGADQIRFLDQFCDDVVPKLRALS
jgi:coenzyme F420-dependent glucose-6-phosphate dehydrogenase